jgi:hypothetical protein
MGTFHYYANESKIAVFWTSLHHFAKNLASSVATFLFKADVISQMIFIAEQKQLHIK